MQKILHQFRKLFTIKYLNNRNKFIYFWKCLRTLNKILLLLCTYQLQGIFRLTDCVGNQSWVSVFIIHTQKKFIFHHTMLYSAVLQTYKIVINKLRVSIGCTKVAIFTSLEPQRQYGCRSIIRQVRKRREFFRLITNSTEMDSNINHLKHQKRNIVSSITKVKKHRVIYGLPCFGVR